MSIVHGVAGLILLFATLCVLLWYLPWGVLYLIFLNRVEDVKRGLFHFLTVLLWDVYYKWYWGHKRRPEDICAERSDHSAAFWSENLEECNASLRAHFEGCVRVLGTIIFVAWLVWCIRSVVWYLFIFLPSLWTRRAWTVHDTHRMTPRTRMITRLLERFTPRRQIPDASHSKLQNTVQ